jgi:SAM-dependent methyltransferase
VEEIRALYGADQAHISAGTHIAGAFRRRLIAKHTLKLITRFVGDGSILEIGSGSGYFLDEARNRGFDVYGIELNSLLADFTRARLGIPCVNTPLDPSLFDGRKFDIIYHRDVISHFYDPIAEFQKMHAMLEDKGFVVFETGNLGDVREKYYRLFAEFQFPDHLFFFSEDNLKTLLERSGFRLLKTHRYSIVPLLVVFDGINKLADRVGPLKKIKRADEASKGRVVSAGLHQSSNREFAVKTAVKNVYNYLYYFVRYKVGYVMPKRARPQTLIIVAQKVDGADSPG